MHHTRRGAGIRVTDGVLSLGASRKAAGRRRGQPRPLLQARPGKGLFPSWNEWPLAEFRSSLAAGRNASPPGWLLSENGPWISVTFASPTRWLAPSKRASQEAAGPVGHASRKTPSAFCSPRTQRCLRRAVFSWSNASRRRGGHDLRPRVPGGQGPWGRVRGRLLQTSPFPSRRIHTCSATACLVW